MILFDLLIVVNCISVQTCTQNVTKFGKDSQAISKIYFVNTQTDNRSETDRQTDNRSENIPCHTLREEGGGGGGEGREEGIKRGGRGMEKISLFGSFAWLLETDGLRTVVGVLTRDITKGHPLAQDMQLQWRRENNQRPATSPIKISGYCSIQNPSLEVLTLTIILILAETVLLSYTYTSLKWSILYTSVESGDDERLHNSNSRKLLPFW